MKNVLLNWKRYTFTDKHPETHNYNNTKTIYIGSIVNSTDGHKDYTVIETDPVVLEVTEGNKVVLIKTKTKTYRLK